MISPFDIERDLQPMITAPNGRDQIVKSWVGYGERWINWNRVCLVFCGRFNTSIVVDDQEVVVNQPMSAIETPAGWFQAKRGIVLVGDRRQDATGLLINPNLVAVVTPKDFPGLFTVIFRHGVSAEVWADFDAFIQAMESNDATTSENVCMKELSA